MHGTSLRENREISGLPPRWRRGGRVGKAMSPKPTMHGPQKSDGPVVRGIRPVEGILQGEDGSGRVRASEVTHAKAQNTDGGRA